MPDLFLKVPPSLVDKYEATDLGKLLKLAKVLVQNLQFAPYLRAQPSKIAPVLGLGRSATFKWLAHAEKIGMLKRVTVADGESLELLEWSLIFGSTKVDSPSTNPDSQSTKMDGQSTLGNENKKHTTYKNKRNKNKEEPVVPPGYHPSPNAPWYLTRKKHELLEMDAGDGLIWMTDIDRKVLTSAPSLCGGSKACFDYWCQTLANHLKQIGNVKKYKDHRATIENWIKREKGMWLDDGPKGAGYYPAWQADKLEGVRC